MEEKAINEDTPKKPKLLEITFRCQSCQKLKPLKEMRSIARFTPVLVVCRDCEKEMR
jgi:hypothetical protein